MAESKILEAYSEIFSLLSSTPFFFNQNQITMLSRIILAISSILFTTTMAFGTYVCDSALSMSPNSTISPTFPASTQNEFWVRFSVTSNQTLLEIIPDGGTIDSVKIYEGGCGSLVLVKNVPYPKEYDSIPFALQLIDYNILNDYKIRLFSSTGTNFTFMLATTVQTSSCLTTPATCDFLCNMSFEQTSRVPAKFSYIWDVQPWQQVLGFNWWTGRSPAVFCGVVPGSSLARTGDAAVSLLSGFNSSTMPLHYGRNSAIGSALNDPIPSNNWIYGEFYIRRMNSTCFYTGKIEGSTDLIEMYFSSGFPSNLSTHQPNPPVTAQISSVDANGNGLINPTTSTYQKVAGLFKVKQGSIDYVSIGDFRAPAFSETRLSSGADYAFSVIDDIFVQELPGAGESQTFTCATLPFSVQIGTGMCDPSDPDLSFSWSPTTGLSNPNSLTPTATISQTTTYTLNVTYRGISYSDEITLTLEEVDLQPRNIVVCNDPIYFTIPYYDASATYTIRSASGLHQYNYNVSSGKLEMSAIEFADDNYKGVSHVILESSNGCVYHAYIVPCCLGPGNPPDEVVIAEDLSDRFSSGSTISAKTFQIGDFMNVDQDMSFDACTFKLQGDAQIYIAEDVAVDFTGCTFEKACDHYWDRIFFTGSGAQFDMTTCMVRESLRGVFMEGQENEIISKRNTFEDNKISMYFKGINTTGPFEDSWLELDGTDFTSTYVTTTYQHPSSPLNLQNYTPNATGFSAFSVNQHSNNYIVVEQSTGINIGTENLGFNTFDANTYMNDGICVFVSEGQCFIENNEFDGLMPHIAAKVAQIKVGGTPDEANSFFNGGSCVTTLGSSQIVENNEIHGEVLILEPTNTAIATEKGTNIVDNEITGTNPNRAVINVASNSNGPLYTRIYRNDIVSGYVDLTDLNPGTEKTIFHSNDLVSAGTHSYFVKAVDCPGIVMAANTVTFNGTYYPQNPPTSSLQPVGFKLEDCPDSKIKGNTLSLLQAGMHLSGDLTSSGTVFACNVFSENEHAIYMDYADINNQGASNFGSDNDFINTVGIDIVGNAGFTGMIDWYYSIGPNHTLFTSGSTNVTTNQILSGGTNPCGIPPNKSSEAIRAKKNELYLEIWPNPAQEELNIKLGGSWAIGDMMIYDAFGRLVQKEFIKSAEQSFSISQLTSGAYIAKFGNQRIRFIKL
jgi:hypothetical protein